MALATAIDLTLGTFVIGDRRAVIFTVTPDSAWLAAGEAFTPGTVGLDRLDLVLIEPAGGYTFAYDRENEKILAYYADYSSGTDGALIPVVDDVDLSAVVFRGIAIGV